MKFTYFRGRIGSIVFHITDALWQVLAISKVHLVNLGGMHYFGPSIFQMVVLTCILVLVIQGAMYFLVFRMHSSATDN